MCTYLLNMFNEGKWLCWPLLPQHYICTQYCNVVIIFQIGFIKRSFDKAIYFKSVELWLFSTRAFSKSHFFLFNITFKTSPNLSPKHLLNRHLNQRVPMETTLSSCLKKIFHVSLTLTNSPFKMLTSSKFMVALNCNRWSNRADCETVLRRLPARMEIPMCSVALVEKWWKAFQE